MGAMSMKQKIERQQNFAKGLRQATQSARHDESKGYCFGGSFGFVVAQVPKLGGGFLFSHLGVSKGGRPLLMTRLRGG